MHGAVIFDIYSRLFILVVIALLYRNPVEVSLSDFSGFQSKGEGSLLNIYDRANTLDSNKSAKNTTQEIKTHTLMPVTYNLTRDNTTENTFESLERYKSAIRYFHRIFICVSV